MAKGNFRLDTGHVREPKTRYTTHGVQRAATTINAYPGDTLASVTERAYGANTQELRDRIQRANPTLEGEIHVPR